MTATIRLVRPTYNAYRDTELWRIDDFEWYEMPAGAVRFYPGGDRVALIENIRAAAKGEPQTE